MNTTPFNTFRASSLLEQSFPNKKLHKIKITFYMLPAILSNLSVSVKVYLTPGFLCNCHNS